MQGFQQSPRHPPISIVKIRTVRSELIFEAQSSRTPIHATQKNAITHFAKVGLYHFWNCGALYKKVQDLPKRH